MAKKIEMTGKKFGRLKVIGENGSLNSYICWRCICDCGSIVTVRGSDLRKGSTKSCGCSHPSAIAASNRVKKKTHGHSANGKTSPTYNSWLAMKRRCFYEKHESYKNYGARGISVCDRWMSFENFLEDMGERPNGKTIDRIDVDADYCPENCRWSSRLDQNRNKRRSAH